MRVRDSQRPLNQRPLLFGQKRPLIPDKRVLIQGLLQLAVAGALLAGPILFYVWTRLEVVRLNYELLDVSGNEREHFMQHERCLVELAMLKSPSRLSFMAKQRFHLKNPTKNQIIHMR